MHISEFMSEDQHHFTWNYRKVSSVIQYGVSSLLAYENESIYAVLVVELKVLQSSPCEYQRALQMES